MYEEYNNTIASDAMHDHRRRVTNHMYVTQSTDAATHIPVRLALGFHGPFGDDALPRLVVEFIRNLLPLSLEHLDRLFERR